MAAAAENNSAALEASESFQSESSLHNGHGAMPSNSSGQPRLPKLAVARSKTPLSQAERSDELLALYQLDNIFDGGAADSVDFAFAVQNGDANPTLDEAGTLAIDGAFAELSAACE